MLKKVLLLFAVFVAATAAPHLLYSYRSYNLLLITIDTLRADYLSSYNSAAVPTPSMDLIAKRGILFTQAYSLIPITLPSHSAILSSRPPHDLLVFNNGDIYGTRTPLLADDLSRAGYRTGAFVSLGVLKSAFGLNRGFQTYSDDFGKPRWYRVASEVNEAALPWIEQNKNSRFFAWIHYSDPHEPYITIDAPPDTEVYVHGKLHSKFCMAKKERNVLHFDAHPGDNKIQFRALSQEPHVVDRVVVKPDTDVEVVYGEGWKERQAGRGKDRYFEDRAEVTIVSNKPGRTPVRVSFRGDVDQSIDVIRKNYTAEVQYVDKNIGVLWDKLQQLGLLRNTIVILTGDHGEGLGTHDRIGHLFPLYREITQVPLLIYYPHLGRDGKRVHALVNHMDIKPTVLDLLHLKSGAPMLGQSLKRYVSWSPVDFLFTRKPDRSRTFIATFAPQGRSNSFAMIHQDLKLIETRTKSDWKWEAYDLKTDPAELRDLTRFEPARLRSLQFDSLRPLLQEYAREAERAQGSHKNPELSDEQKRMLRDLGYVAP
jgi:arylsulfatase A-like enzyme